MTAPTTGSSARTQPAEPGTLAGGVLGLPSVLFCIVTGAAPLAAMLFNVPVATLGGASCSFPRYSAEPAPGPQFGDLSDYPIAVTVRLSCVGIALLEVVRLTDEKILIGEGDAVFELERRR